MGFILPSYLVHQRRFKCPNCQFAFIKQTPSQVESCPMCKQNGWTIACLERGVKEENLDSYSRTKLRWYSQAEGKAHEDEVRHRRIVSEDGKKKTVVVDSKGRKIDEVPIITHPKKEIDWSKGSTFKTVKDL